MSLFARVLRWAGAVAEPAKPETDWRRVGCSDNCRFEHTVVSSECGYAREPVTVLDDSAPVVEESGCELDEALEPVPAESEGRVLDRLAELSTRMSPWDAAVAVFGGAAVTRDASRAGLSATVAGEPAGSAPR